MARSDGSEAEKVAMMADALMAKRPLKRIYALALIEIMPCPLRMLPPKPISAVI